jgi:CBS domain containing-hemolysin-like protein
VLILLTSLSVAAEFALVSVDRGLVEGRAESGDKRARNILRSLRSLSFELSTAQFGITVSSLVLGFVASPTIGRALEPLLEGMGLGDRAAEQVATVLALVIATVASMVLGELAPKALAITHPYETAAWTASPLRWISISCALPIRFLNGSANWVVRRLGMEPKEELASARTLEELDLLIRSSGAHGVVEPEEVALMTRAIGFARRNAAEALTPRVAVVALSHDATVADLVAKSVSTGLSRFPVYEGDLDHVLGVAHAKDALGVPGAARATTRVTELLAPPLVVPESSELADLLLEMRRTRRQLALVVDEHGGTAGIITLEDLLEEIVGDIEDEFDRRSAPVVATRGADLVLDGRLRPDEVEERTDGLEIPDGDYETLAGFLLARLGRIPEVGDVVHHGGWRLEVSAMDGLRIAAVTARPEPVAWADEGEAAGPPGDGAA